MVSEYTVLGVTVIIFFLTPPLFVKKFFTSPRGIWIVKVNTIEGMRGTVVSATYSQHTFLVPSYLTLPPRSEYTEWCLCRRELEPGRVMGLSGARKLYTTSNGGVTLRATTHIEVSSVLR